MKRFSFFLLCFLALCLPVRAGGAEEQRECANILSAARLAPDAPLSEEGLALLLPGPQVLALSGLVLVGLGCAPIYPSIIHSTPEHLSLIHI